MNTSCFLTSKENVDFILSGGGGREALIRQNFPQLLHKKNSSSALCRHPYLLRTPTCSWATGKLIKAPACTAQPACQACQSSWQCQRDYDLTITRLIGIRRTCSPPHCRLNKHRGRQDATLSPRVSLAHLTGCNSYRGVFNLCVPFTEPFSYFYTHHQPNSCRPPWGSAPAGQLDFLHIVSVILRRLLLVCFLPTCYPNTFCVCLHTSACPDKERCHWGSCQSKGQRPFPAAKQTDNWKRQLPFLPSPAPPSLPWAWMGDKNRAVTFLEN